MYNPCVIIDRVPCISWKIRAKARQAQFTGDVIEHGITYFGTCDWIRAGMATLAGNISIIRRVTCCLFDSPRALPGIAMRSSISGYAVIDDRWHIVGYC